MDQQSKPQTGPAQPSLSEVLAMFDAMKQEFAAQRADLEHKVSRLESELIQVRQVEPGPTTVVAPTSRRRMLKKLVAGAAGAAALGVAATGAIPSVQAGNLDFNGTGGSGGSNAATGITSITASVAEPTAFPVLQINNLNTQSQGTDINNPSTRSIAISAQAAASFAIYGKSTGGSGAAATGIIGISGGADLVVSTGQPGSTVSPVFQNRFGGVVGASNANAGTVGISLNNSGVVGVSGAKEGVKGVGQSGVGGYFYNQSDSTTDPGSNQGAAMRLGLRNSSAAPNSKPTGSGPFQHDAGEVAVDIYGRVYVCIAGFVPAARDALNGPAVGYTNPNNSNWRFLAPMAVKSGKPTNPAAADQELHIPGEMWLDATDGAMYVCTTPGSFNASVPLLNTPPVFKQLSGIQLFPQGPDRFIDTRPIYTRNGVAGQRIGTVVAGNAANSTFADKENRTYKLTAIASLGDPLPNTFNYTGVNTRKIPDGAVGIVGVISAVGPVTAGTPFLTLWPSDNALATVATPTTPLRPSVANLVYPQNGVSIANNFTVALTKAGRLSVYCHRKTDITIDIAGYF